MGRLSCLFMCYRGQELHRAMDGGGSDCIEEGLRNGQRKVNIRGSMKEKAGGSFWYAISSGICSS